jgi:hypothetical protein
MNKTIEAWLRGYYKFIVSSPAGLQHFRTYNAANAALEAIPRDQNAAMAGWHVWKGLIGFYERHIERQS